MPIWWQSPMTNKVRDCGPNFSKVSKRAGKRSSRTWQTSGTSKTHSGTTLWHYKRSRRRSMKLGSSARPKNNNRLRIRSQTWRKNWIFIDAIRMRWASNWIKRNGSKFSRIMTRQPLRSLWVKRCSLSDKLRQLSGFKVGGEWLSWEPGSWSSEGLEIRQRSASNARGSTSWWFVYGQKC